MIFYICFEDRKIISFLEKEKFVCVNNILNSNRVVVHDGSHLLCITILRMLTYGKNAHMKV